MTSDEEKTLAASLPSGWCAFADGKGDHVYCMDAKHAKYFRGLGHWREIERGEPVPGPAAPSGIFSEFGLAKIIREATAMLEEIVCTEPPDDGLIMLSDESPTHRDPETGIATYDHAHFSPLGDALIALHKKLTGAK